jgi:RsbT co-antagonist protein rsbRD N-terminal domain
VAAILERARESIVQEWFARIQADEQTSSIPIPIPIPMSYELRCGHLTPALSELISRLSSPRPVARKESSSAFAAKHGQDRLRQGYTVAMLAEEYRLLQQCVFHALQTNLANINHSILLHGAMTIADEINAQLAHALAGYSAESMRLVARLLECPPPHGDIHLSA